MVIQDKKHVLLANLVMVMTQEKNNVYPVIIIHILLVVLNHAKNVHLTGHLFTMGKLGLRSNRALHVNLVMGMIRRKKRVHHVP